MRDDVRIIRERQKAMRREIDRRGIALKQIHFDSGIPMATLLSYLPVKHDVDPAVMPVSALYALVDALPADIVSLLMPSGRAIVAVPEQMDPDKLGEMARAYLCDMGSFTHPDSEDGRELSDTESNILLFRAAEMRGAA